VSLPNGSLSDGGAQRFEPQELPERHFRPAGAGDRLVNRGEIAFRGARRFLLAWGIVLLYGLIDEWIQSANPSRQADPLDWVADAAGSLLAIALYRGWAWYRGALETPVFGFLAKARRSSSNPAR